MEQRRLDELIKQLETGDDRQRRAASYKLSKLKETEAVTALMHVIHDADDSVRRNAIAGLRSSGSDPAAGPTPWPKG